MSDPFERLVSGASVDASPDMDAIRLRAHRIQRRRQTGVASAGVAALAVIAVVGVLLTTGSDDKPKSLAEASQTAAPETSAARQAPAADMTVGESKVAPGSSTSKAVGGGAATAGSAPSAGRSSSSDSAAVGVAAQPQKVEELNATLDVEDQTIGRGKTFTLKVCNVTSGSVKRSFGSSQRYDFEVSQNDKLVWRWSDGMFFTQVVGEETWKSKECKTWTADWDATNSDGTPVATGDYEAVGILKTSPELRTSPKTVTVSAL